MPPNIAVDRYYQDTSKSLFLGYHLAQRVGQYHDLWQAQQRKVHHQKLSLEQLVLEARDLADTSKRSTDLCHRVVMERDSLSVVIRSRDHLLEILKAEVSTLRSEEKMRRAELEKEKADFVEKVAERIA
ncbi:hypothetical protein U1Q18_004449 [Sarracenia purpurea var. burkii]